MLLVIICFIKNAAEKHTDNFKPTHSGGKALALYMKILMILMGLDIGGAETHVIELSKQLISRGHDIMIAANRGAYTPEAVKCGIRFFDVPLHERKLGCMYKSYCLLKNIIKAEKPDIVHAHARIPAFLCHLIRKSVKFNFVTSAHGTYNTSFALKTLTRWGDYSIAVSDDIKEYLIKNYKIPAKNIIVSVNGVDVDKFSPDADYGSIYEEMKLSPETPRIVYMSRLNDDVCLPAYRLLDIFPDIEKQSPGIEIMIIGDGDSFENLRMKAEEINSSLGRRAVILTGARVDVYRLISSATICIGVGRAILESMAMGKPVIVAGIEGYIGIFGHSKYTDCVETNFTCRGKMPLDNETFKTDILKILDMSEDERNSLGVYGRTIVKNHYSLEKMVDDNIQLYRLGMRGYKYDAAVLGYYGFRNSGDDALLYAMIHSLQQTKPDIRICVFSFNPAETSEVYGVDSVLRYDLPKLIKTLKQTKMFILGGGSLIQDITSTKSAIYYLYITGKARKYCSKVMLYANGIGPLRKESNRKKAARVLNTVDYITLRDDDSAAELAKLHVTAPPVKVTADPVFGIDKISDVSVSEMLKSAGVDENRRFTCISVRKWNDAPDNFDALCAEMADYIASKYGLLPVFIPMQYPYDAALSRSIVSKMTQKGVFISHRLDIPSTLGIVEKSSMVISVRLHLLIYATMFSVPAIGIAYDPKVSNFQKLINQPYFLDPRALIGGDYKTLIDKCMENAENIKEQLTVSSEKLRERALETAQIAMELLEK